MPDCPQCGAELGSADPGGLCPQCLILSALGSSGSSEVGTHTGGPASVTPGEDFGRYRIIDFEDDNLTYYKAAFKELCRRIIARYPAGALELVAMNGISYLSLDDEALELMAAAGFSHLNLALVSSDGESHWMEGVQLLALYAMLAVAFYFLPIL